jgi:hypothetical protein
MSRSNAVAVLFQQADSRPKADTAATAAEPSAALIDAVRAEFDIFRAELLRQKIVFEGELRRQREVFEARIDRLERTRDDSAKDNVHLRSSIHSLSARLEALERGRPARSSSRGGQDGATTPSTHAPSTPRESTARPPSPVRTFERAPSAGSTNPRGRSPASRDLVALGSRPSLLALPPPTFRAALQLTRLPSSK